MELDDAEYRLKPMNCPGHILIYKDSLKSYRDLPVRLGELGTVYRYERSGVMHGLLRVRGFTQDDAHIFCTPDQIENEIVGCLEFALAVLTPSASTSSRPNSLPGIRTTRKFPRHRRPVGPGQPLAQKRAQKVNSIQVHPRRSRILRPQDRHQTGRRHRPPLATLHRPVRLQPAPALRSRIRRRRRHPQSTAHGPPRSLRLRRALLRRPHRTLRRSLPRLALPRSGSHVPIAERHIDYAEKVASHSRPPAPASKSIPAMKK